MSTSWGEYLEMDCPHCGKRIEVRARILSDDDTVVFDYGEEEEPSGESFIHTGDKVRVVRIDTEHKATREHLSCFLGQVGVVKSEPEYKELLHGLIKARGECWVEFEHPCLKHGDTGGAFIVSELEKLNE